MDKIHLPVESESFADRLLNIDQERVEATVRKLQALDPEGVSKVGLATISQVAHIAILLHANPLPHAGEVWYWMDRGKPVIYLGIAYYNRISRKYDPIGFLLDDNGEPFHARPMTKEEREYHAVNAGDLGYICKGYRIKAIAELTSMGFDWETATKSVARVGIGIVHKRQMFRQKDTQYHKAGDPIDPPNGRSWGWVAEKRAMTDLYRGLGITHPLVQEMLDFEDEPWDDHYQDDHAEEVADLKNVIDEETMHFTEAEVMVWDDARNFLPALCIKHYQAEAYARGTIREIFVMGEKSIPQGNHIEDRRVRIQLFRAVIQFHELASQQSYTYALQEWKEMDHPEEVRKVIGRKPSVILAEALAEQKANRS